MLTSDPIVASAESVDAAKSYLRLDGDEDDIAIASFVVAASAQCEAFIGDVLAERGFVERTAASNCWPVLTARPVTAITTVADDNGVPLASGSFEVDIDSDGIGRVRLTAVPSQRLRITYRAGKAGSWGGIAEAVRLGIVRQVAHYYAGRDGNGGDGPPAAVAALWRGARRMRLT